MIIFARSESEINTTVRTLQSKFDIKVLGKTRKLLGIEFEKEHDKIYLHQTNYITKVCQMFDQYDVKCVSNKETSSNVKSNFFLKFLLFVVYDVVNT